MDYNVNRKDRARWSAWREANYGYFEHHLRNLPAHMRLVDLGTGNLQFGSLFKRFDFIGVDFEPYPEVSVVADLTKDFPLGSQCADIVTLSNVVEHIPNSEHFLSECARILKPGGLLIGTIPFLMQVHQAPHDYNRYTHFQIERLLARAGFREITVEPLGNLIDAYNTLELKFFDLYPRFHPVRLLRRLEMRIMSRIFREAASHKMTEGYGFRATK